MKTLISALLVMAMFHLQAQNFIKHYFSECEWAIPNPPAPDPPVPVPTEMKFSCIIQKDYNLLIAGTQNDMATPANYAIVLQEVDEFGGIVDIRTIFLEDPDVRVTPTGLIWESHASDEFVIICGYTGILSGTGANTPHAFVLKYNYVSHTVNWVTMYDENQSEFFDIVALDDGYLVCGEYYGSSDQDALFCSVDPTFGVLTPVLQIRAFTSDHAADTWYSMERKENYVFLTDRFEYYPDDGYERNEAWCYPV
ncbi:MAG: hypothetical protein ACHQFW_10995 [Chitinophagales bacterium]